MTRYTVVEASEPNRFLDRVNQHIKDGWQLVGGVSICQIRLDFPDLDYQINPVTYAQAMIKETKE